VHLRFCSKQRTQVSKSGYFSTYIIIFISNQINLEEISLDLLIFLLKQLVT